ncbi:MAG: Asp-tRNA(Asn)/Glu-tRNA(Gln) amidotransferase GatCAB subunit A, partial [Cutibacterium acnes]
MNELLTLTAAELGERIAARQISSEEVTQAHLDRISEVDGDIHAFLLVDHASVVNEQEGMDVAV